ncbi:MAG TPA: bifunctional folylpolyglutamate synthase/dihydrofolate synthase [Chloroflexi bacterium]|nr:bifunctional folylpolyglutamate synthase/dihydrofolate synthase [Chloroflexota bacterium]
MTLTYNEALDYLYSLIDYEKTRIARYDPKTLNLERVARLLEALGNPHRCYPTLHIAGTKGKGSVAAMCESALRASGVHTGLYTSPHLHTFRERIRVDGWPADPHAIADLVSRLQHLLPDHPGITWFEAVTAIAFLYFAEMGVEFAVVEVGLGGRLDATNVITPQVSVITSLSYDHTYLLGDSLAQIAAEKGGIIKPGVPVVSAPQAEEALTVLMEIAEARQAPLTLVGRDWQWEFEEESLDWQRFTVRRIPAQPGDLSGPYQIPLLGRHQLDNATVALAALDLLREAGLPLSQEAVQEGLSTVRWPGRFEVLDRTIPLVVDCAHNGDSAAKLAAALAEWFPGRRWTFVFGASNDKDVAGMLTALRPVAARFLFTRSRHPRAADPTALAAVAGDDLPFETIADLPTALQRALLLAGPEEGVCATGSIFIVADARETWSWLTGHLLLEVEPDVIWHPLPHPAAESLV